ncbi:MAG: zinc ribbon domain-containing protein [Candidatus Cohnella colombiensis]|uniref:Zinc ribbon domain-containing protein n=1 Tax=Candidatus Cohnella colombiensis TaxID=3121368 RepID=A0AA95EXX6_9BACL|nr:MAG: zinc ribbon domain-containing protein [Cohnella sp.]
MNCPNCNSVVEGDVSFCGTCGGKIERVVQTVDPVTTVVPATPILPAQPAQPVQPPSQPPVQSSPKQLPPIGPIFSKYKFVIGGVIGAALLVWVVIAFILPMFQSKDAPLIYMGRNSLEMQISGVEKPIELSTSLMSSSDWSNISSDLSWMMSSGNFVKLNEKKDKLFFIKKINDDYAATLYYRDLNKKASSWDDEQGVKLASGIRFGYNTFSINKKGTAIIYSKEVENTYGNKLYLHNLKDELLIDTRVTNYWYSEDQSLIIYTKTNDDDESSVYMVRTDKLDDKVKMDSNIAYMLNVDLKTGNINYVKYVEDKNGERLSTIYSKALDKDKVKLIDGVYSVVSQIDNNSFYYTVAVKNEVELASLVEDDFAVADAALTEPTYENFQTVVSTPYTDWWSGETYYQDVVNTDYDAYYAAYDNYSAKRSRDQLRQNLSGQTYSDVSYSLYAFNNGESKKITDDYANDYYSSSSTYSNLKNKLIFYKKNDRSTMNKLKLSEISYADDVYEAYRNLTTSSPTLYVANLQAVSSEHLQDGEQLDSIALSSDGKQLFSIEYKKSAKSLVVYDLVEGKLSNRKVIDEDVSRMQYIENKSRLYYYKEESNNSAELYQYVDGKSTRIALDVRLGYSTYYEENDVLLFMTDFYSSSSTGTLSKYSNNKTTKIANDVGHYFFNGSSEIYYLADYNDSRGYGDLKKFTTKDNAPIIAERVYFMYELEQGTSF